MTTYRLHEWDEEALRERPVRFICVHCKRGIDEIQQYGIECLPGRPTEPPTPAATSTEQRESPE